MCKIVKMNNESMKKRKETIENESDSKDIFFKKSTIFSMFV